MSTRIDATASAQRSRHYGLLLLLFTVAMLFLWPRLLPNILNSDRFMPHGMCYLWIPQLVSLHLISDSLIGLSYVSISATLAYLVYRGRRDIPFHWIFLAFGLFIVACGSTHFMEVWTVWQPVFWLSGYVKLITAVASVATAVVLPPLVPKTLALVQSAKLSEERRTSLANANKELEALRERERQRLEARLDQWQQLFQHAGWGVAIIDPQNLALKAVNPSFARMLGYSVEELAGMPLAETFAPQSRTELPGHLQIADQKGHHVYDSFHISKDERVFPVLVDLIAIKDAAGEVIYRAANFQDITERKGVEEERQQLLEREQKARAESEAASRAKDQFLAITSHELRTPLTSILGWAQMLRTGELDEAARLRGLATIERNARLQAQLVADVLDISRIVTGRLRLDVRPVELAPIIEAAVDSVRPAAEAKGIRLQPLMDRGANIIAGDPDRLQQIVWNLLANAIKFTPKGGRVQIRLERINSHVEIVVSDNGTGIDPDVLPFVFERFVQADSSTTRKYSGLGLGLAIARELVELHGGSIEVSSAGNGQGSTFNVVFPLMAVQPSRLGQQQRIPGDLAASLENSELLKGVRVLVVDDDQETRDVIEMMLKKFGAEAFTADSAQAALETIKQTRPDVLLSDIGMPEMDGNQLIRLIRELPEGQGGNIPAAALTAYAGVEDRMRSLLAGYQIHVPKPVDPSELIAVVASLSGRTAKF